MIDQPELLPYEAPCSRCGNIRALAASNQLCWTPPEQDSRSDDESCWRGNQLAHLRDKAQDIIRADRRRRLWRHGLLTIAA